MGEPSDEELDRPMMWRFWRALPPKGKIGVFLGSWYTWPILNRVNGVTKDADLEQSMERAKRLEQMLVDEGALLIKFWLHLSKEKQERRCKELEKNPLTRWKVRWLRSFGQGVVLFKWSLCLLLGCLFDRRQHHGIRFVRCFFL